MDMIKVMCPNCGTEFEHSYGKCQRLPADAQGNAYLVPKKIHNDNVVRKEMKTMNLFNNADKETNNNTTNTTTKENKNMGNFTMEELTQVVAATMAQLQGGNTMQTANTSATATQATGDYWAKNSKFYGKVMADGHIFNPYLDRRWLPAEYLRLCKMENGSGYNAIKNHYNFNYQMDWLKKEVGKLAYLQKVDKVAYTERKQFLTMFDVRRIVAEYVKEVDKIINYATRVGNTIVQFGRRKVHTGDKAYKLINDGLGCETYFKVSEEVFDIRRKQTELLNEISRLGGEDYKTASELLNTFKFLEFDWRKKPTSNFINVFMAQGAYYTLRNLVLFENYNFKGYSGAEAMEVLTRLPRNAEYYGYRIHGALKNCLMENGETF